MVRSRKLNGILSSLCVFKQQWHSTNSSFFLKLSCCVLSPSHLFRFLFDLFCILRAHKMDDKNKKRTKWKTCKCGMERSQRDANAKGYMKQILDLIFAFEQWSNDNWTFAHVCFLNSILLIFWESNSKPKKKKPLGLVSAYCTNFFFVLHAKVLMEISKNTHKNAKKMSIKLP